MRWLLRKLLLHSLHRLLPAPLLTTRLLQLLQLFAAQLGLLLRQLKSLRSRIVDPDWIRI
jgi:hypothetical protein